MQLRLLENTTGPSSFRATLVALIIMSLPFRIKLESAIKILNVHEEFIMPSASNIVPEFIANLQP